MLLLVTLMTVITIWVNKTTDKANISWLTKCVRESISYPELNLFMITSIEVHWKF